MMHDLGRLLVPDERIAPGLHRHKRAEQILPLGGQSILKSLWAHAIQNSIENALLDKTRESIGKDIGRNAERDQ